MPSRSALRSALHCLCGCCGTITPESEWTAWMLDDETDELVPATDQTDPILRCPICSHDFTDDDAGPCLWMGSRREMEAERDAYLEGGALNAVDNWVAKLEEVIRADRADAEALAHAVSARLNRQDRSPLHDALAAYLENHPWSDL